jgi:ribonuclease BN (tRNA processing enzyme)
MEVIKVQHNQLRLETDGRIGVFFIGVGSAFTKKNYQNNIIIVKGNDHILVDCGTLCSLSLHEIGLPITSLKNIFLTHIHADHTGGMEELFLMNRFITKTKPDLIIPADFENLLWNETLKGGSGYSERKEGKYLELSDFVTVIHPEMDTDIGFRETYKVQIGSMGLQFPRTRHIPDSAVTWKDAVLSYAVIIDKKIMFTSDTMFDRELVEEFDRLYDFKYIFHDCQLYKGGVHAALEELVTLPETLRKKMILMHYGDNRDAFESKRVDAGFHSWAEKHTLYLF